MKTGSSLYSRIGTTHMSMPCFFISAGRTVVRRCCEPLLLAIGLFPQGAERASGLGGERERQRWQEDRTSLVRMDVRLGLLLQPLLAASDCSLLPTGGWRLATASFVASAPQGRRYELLLLATVQRAASQRILLADRLTSRRLGSASYCDCFSCTATAVCSRCSRRSNIYRTNCTTPASSSANRHTTTRRHRNVCAAISSQSCG